MSAPVIDQHIVSQALEAARKSVAAGQGGPFGAVVFSSQSMDIISVSANQVLKNHDPTGHAEIEAIRAACGRLARPELAGCSLYATGQPCPMCLAAIYWARLDAYYYTTTYAEASAIGFDDAPILEAIKGTGPALVRGTHVPSDEVREFFLKYDGQMY